MSTKQTQLVNLTDRDGVPMACSRDIAEHFEKDHRSVLRAVDALACSQEFRVRNFAQGVYTLPATGSQEHRELWMTYDGFTFLVMGFTGKKAGEWKEKYIAAFNEMKRRLSDPLRPENILCMMNALQAKVAEQQAIETLEPKALGFNRVAESDGSLCFIDAAKTLQMKPKALIQWLASMNWIYRRPGGRSWIGRAEKIYSGCLQHKVFIQTIDDEDRARTQCLITSKGLAVLSQKLSSAN